MAAGADVEDWVRGIAGQARALLVFVEVKFWVLASWVTLPGGFVMVLAALAAGLAGRIF